MIWKCILLLAAALLLANCCAVGIGCAPPPGVSIAWGGPGARTAEDSEGDEPQRTKHARATRQITGDHLDAAAGGPTAKPQPKDNWEQQQAADQADEARLKRKLTICRACVTNDSARDEATGSLNR
jgi:hypothetical protein